MSENNEIVITTRDNALRKCRYLTFVFFDDENESKNFTQILIGYSETGCYLRPKFIEHHNADNNKITINRNLKFSEYDSRNLFDEPSILIDFCRENGIDVHSPYFEDEESVSYLTILSYLDIVINYTLSPTEEIFDDLVVTNERELKEGIEEEYEEEEEIKAYRKDVFYDNGKKIIIMHEI